LFGLGTVVPLGPLHCLQHLLQYLQEAGEVSDGFCDLNHLLSI
jgi:hypothetical protein